MTDNVRVHEVAKELGISSKETVDFFNKLGIPTKTASSIVTLQEADKVMKYAIDGNSATIPTSDNIKYIEIEIENLKSIQSLKWGFELKKGIKVIIGNNGIGKSSLIAALSKLVKPSTLQDEFIGRGYHDSLISYNIDKTVYVWHKKPGWKIFEFNQSNMPKLIGFTEGSILNGDRFKTIDKTRKDIQTTSEDKVVKATDFIKLNMNEIIYGEKSHKFDELYYIATKRRKHSRGQAKEHEYHAILKDDFYYHDIYFSTGEYFLLSLLKFIDKFKHERQNETPALIIIDEIELSLHPLAQMRLMQKLRCFVNEYNLLIIFATHSLQIIEEVKPEEVYYLSNNNGLCTFISPMYPGFLTSKLYKHTYFDRVILVEDDLAKKFIEHILEELDLGNITYKIIPIGGWEKVLEISNLHKSSQIYGNAIAVPILDGDMSEKANKNPHKKVKKLFLPIDNIEKYIVTKCKDQDNSIVEFIDRIIYPKVLRDLNVNFNNIKSKDIKTSFNKLIIEVAVQIKSSEEVVKNKFVAKCIKEIKGTPKFESFHQNLIKECKLNIQPKG